MAHAREHSLLSGYAPRSTSYDGRFGRLFGKLPPWVPPGATEAEQLENIKAFAADKMFLPVGQEPPPHPDLPAGYTYFGQFIDHDITFDPTSSLTRQNDPDGLNNFRTPRLDLDNIYGRGPDDQPYLYQQTRTDGGVGFLLTGTGANGVEPDLARIQQKSPTGNPGKDKSIALIGDPRNDENIIVSQLQLAMIQLHNEVLRRLRQSDEEKKAEADSAGKIFTIDPPAQFHEAQRIVRWFYQYLVWNDFVKRLVPAKVWEAALSPSDTGAGLKLGLKDVYNWKVNPYIPVEFSVAAYRFGHSLIRTGYQLNIIRQLAANSQQPVGPQHELPIFDFSGEGKEDLRGGRPLPNLFSLQWDWFFSMGSPGGFPQKANKIDMLLSRAVFAIPGAEGTNPLAELNIRRGWRFGLPSGTDVARAMGFEPIPVEEKMQDALWVYILREAQIQEGGRRLGMVGGTIVAAVFAGLLKGDPLSYVQQFPNWTPDKEPVLAAGPRRRPPRADLPEVHDLSQWDIRDLLTIANMPIDGDGITGVTTNGPLPPTVVPPPPTTTP